MHVLAGSQRGQTDSRVPMIRRADRDDVDVLPVEQLAVLTEDIRLAAEQILVEIAGAIRVHIAQRDDIAVTFDRVRIASPHAAVADAADFGPFVWRLGFLSQRAIRTAPHRHQTAGSGQCGQLQKISASRVRHDSSFAEFRW